MYDQEFFCSNSREACNTIEMSIKYLFLYELSNFL